MRLIGAESADKEPREERFNRFGPAAAAFPEGAPPLALESINESCPEKTKAGFRTFP
jgi:hypothetical protein